MSHPTSYKYNSVKTRSRALFCPQCTITLWSVSSHDELWKIVPHLDILKRDKVTGVLQLVRYIRRVFFIYVPIHYTASVLHSCVLPLTSCFNYTMIYCADILGKAWSRNLTSRLYVTGKAIDFVVLFCDISEHVPLNTGTMDFNSFRDSNLFLDFFLILRKPSLCVTLYIYIYIYFFFSRHTQ